MGNSLSVKYQLRMEMERSQTVSVSYPPPLHHIWMCVKLSEREKPVVTSRMPVTAASSD